MLYKNTDMSYKRYILSQSRHTKERVMPTPDAITLVILIGTLFLLYKALKSADERPFADLSEAEIALEKWKIAHRDIHPGDYPAGRRLAERYHDALLAAARTVPTMKDDPDHLSSLEYAKRMTVPRNSGSFHVIA
jgi:hypothetical protein